MHAVVLRAGGVVGRECHTGRSALAPLNVPETLLIHIVPDLRLDLLVGAGARQIGPCRIHIYWSAAQSHELRIAIGDGRATEVNLGDGTGNADNLHSDAACARYGVVAQINTGGESIYAAGDIDVQTSATVVHRVAGHGRIPDAAAHVDSGPLAAVNAITRNLQTGAGKGAPLAAEQVDGTGPTVTIDVAEGVVRCASAVGPDLEAQIHVLEGVAFDGRVSQRAHVESGLVAGEVVVRDLGIAARAVEDSVNRGTLEVVVLDLKTVERSSAEVEVGVTTRGAEHQVVGDVQVGAAAGIKLNGAAATMAVREVKDVVDDAQVVGVGVAVDAPHAAAGELEAVDSDITG